MATARVRYLDLVRVVAVSAVAVGHWLLVDVTYRHGTLSGRNALELVHWAGWLTLAFQVIPAFFLVGGYVNAVSWPAHRARGATPTGWVYRRSVRLLWPTTVYIAVMTLAVAAVRAAGAPRAPLADAGWLVALHLWFVPVYLLMIALTPLALAAHRRWGLRVPAVATAAAAVVDVAAVAGHVPVVGFANYLLVWGTVHQLGFAWQDGRLRRPSWLPLALVGAGVAALAALTSIGPFPVDMIGAGEHPGNTSPPSMALLAFAVAQTGLVIAAAPAGARLVRREAWRRWVDRFDPTVITIYLWHMVPVVVVAAAVYPTVHLPQPDVGSGQWWVLRLAWVGVLAALLVPLVAAVTWLERPLRSLSPQLRPRVAWVPVSTGLGLVAAGVALARLAIRGFAPGGELAVAPLVTYAAGFGLLLLASTDRRLVRT